MNVYYTRGNAPSFRYQTAGWAGDLTVCMPSTEYFPPWYYVYVIYQHLPDLLGGSALDTCSGHTPHTIAISVHHNLPHRAIYYNSSVVDITLIN